MNTNLKRGDLVFAKIRSYPYWPGTLMNIRKSKAEIKFFGTGQIGFCSVDNVVEYNPITEHMFNKSKTKGFVEAMSQIHRKSLSKKPTRSKLQSGVFDSTLEGSPATTSTSSRHNETPKPGGDDVRKTKRTNATTAETPDSSSRLMPKADVANFNETKFDDSEDDAAKDIESKDDSGRTLGTSPSSISLFDETKLDIDDSGTTPVSSTSTMRAPREVENTKPVSKTSTPKSSSTATAPSQRSHLHHLQSAVIVSNLEGSPATTNKIGIDPSSSGDVAEDLADPKPTMSLNQIRKRNIEEKNQLLKSLFGKQSTRLHVEDDPESDYKPSDDDEESSERQGNISRHKRSYLQSRERHNALQQQREDQGPTSECTQPIIANSEVNLSSLRAKILELECSSHKITYSNLNKMQQIEVLWKHYKLFHLEDIKLYRQPEFGWRRIMEERTGLTCKVCEAEYSPTWWESLAQIRCNRCYLSADVFGNFDYKYISKCHQLRNEDPKHRCSTCKTNFSHMWKGPKGQLCRNCAYAASLTRSQRPRGKLSKDQVNDDLPDDEDSGDKKEGSEVVRDNPVVPKMDLGTLLDAIVASDEPDDDLPADDLPIDEDSVDKKQEVSDVILDNPVVSNIVQTLLRQRPPVKPENIADISPYHSDDTMSETDLKQFANEMKGLVGVENEVYNLLYGENTTGEKQRQLAGIVAKEYNLKNHRGCRTMASQAKNISDGTPGPTSAKKATKSASSRAKKTATSASSRRPKRKRMIIRSPMSSDDEENFLDPSIAKKNFQLVKTLRAEIKELKREKKILYDALDRQNKMFPKKSLSISSG